jgi:hemoglobin
MNPDPENTPFDMLGGAPAVRALVDRFYDLMDTLPEAYGIRKLHPPDLTGSRDKLYKFLSGWLGGPPLYVQEHGHPMLRRRHLPFPIGQAEREQWMMCMRQALEDAGIEAGLKAHLEHALGQVADHMRNRP